jgi:hypothetical protein
VEAGSQRSWLLLPVALLLAMLPLWRAFELPGISMDEGTLLVYPELILQGKLPYRDFETFYGPANLWVLAGFYQVFGVAIEVERAVGLLYRLLLLAGIFVVARRWGASLGLVCTVAASFLLFLARLPAYAWFGGLACILWSLIVLAGAAERRWRAALAGVFAALGLLYRVDLGPAVIASALPLWLLLPARARWIYLGGFAAGLLPLVVLAGVAGWRPLFDNLFLYPVVIVNPARRLPLSEANGEVLFMFWLHLGAALCSVVAGLLAVKKNRREMAPRLFLAMALLALGLTHQGMQRADVVHVVFAGFLSVALLPLALARLVCRGRPQWGALTAGLALAALFSGGCPGVFPLYREQVARTFSSIPARVMEVRVRERRFLTNFQPAPLQEALLFLEKHSRPGERLFVGTGDLRQTFANDTFIYHLLPWLTPATYFLEMNPLSANRPGSRLADDVASADWLVLNQAWDNPRESNLSGQHGSDAPNAVVRERFELRGQAGSFLVYHRKAGP